MAEKRTIDRGTHFRVVESRGDSQIVSLHWKDERGGMKPEPYWSGASSAPVELGDVIEAVLTSVGITKERWIALKEQFGLPPTCNCEARKQWLNNLGLGEKLDAFKQAMRWK